jgi:hypothetical protein
MEKAQKILDFIIVESDKATSYFSNIQKNNINLFALSMIDRLNFSSHSLKILIAAITENTKIEYSCGIIIRALLLDYMVLLNGIDILLKKNSDERIKELNGYCSSMLAGSMKHRINDIATLHGHSPKKYLDKEYSNIVDMNPDFFKVYNKKGKPELKDELKERKNGDLFKTIKNGVLNSYSNIYEEYLYYSKYDHFGQMFYEFTRSNSTERLDKVNTLIVYHFPFILHYSLFVLEAIYSSDDFIKEQKRKVEGVIINDVESGK